MDIEKEMINLIKEVSAMKAQLSTLWKIFIGVAIGSIDNFILNVKVHYGNGKKK